MIEALVAAVVFAFGAIGAAGMQALSLQSNQEGMQRMQAAYLAGDMLERMQNNAAALDRYDTGGDEQWTLLGASSQRQRPSTDCTQAACTPTQLAAHDLWSWEQAVEGAAVAQTGIPNAGGLKDPTACIRQVEAGEIELAIAWRGRGELSNSATAPECTVEQRYGADDRFRRVLLVRTYIAP